MSIKIVREEIKRFLEEKGSEVLCLKGKWGVGKTYAWNRYLQEVSDKGKLAFNKYAYVSLFGLNSLDDVKFSLFESTLGQGDLKHRPTPETLQKGFDWLKKNYKKVTAWASQNPFIQSYLGKTEKGLFFFVRDQIVCIDDLERAGRGLTTKDVFGLISYLKEQRNCKVVLILNDEQLSADDKISYEKFLEKVIDTKLDFSPTSREAADIVFPTPTENQALIHKNCVSLGITNIRIIKKIEKLVSRFEEIFGKDNKLMNQIIHSSVLFAWSAYQPDEAPAMDFLKDFARLHGLGGDKDKTPEKERSWQELVRAYGYTSTDEFDATIFETVQNGYFDADRLGKAGSKQLANINDIDTKKQFEDAWNLYHNSFDDNEKEVLDALYSSAKKAVRFIEPTNLDSTISFLKEFGRPKEAKDLINHYIKTRGDEKDLFDLQRPLFSRNISDPDLIEAFKKQRGSFADSRDPAMVLADIYTNHGWNLEDIDLLAKLSADEFYEIFKKTKDLDLHRIIKAALDFGRISDASDDMKEISKRATLALQKIGLETGLNAKRVTTHGVKITEDDTRE
jgi:hypothetical protein